MTRCVDLEKNGASPGDRAARWRSRSVHLLFCRDAQSVVRDAYECWADGPLVREVVMAEIDPKRVAELAKKPPRVLPSGEPPRGAAAEARAVVKEQVSAGKRPGRR